MFTCLLTSPRRHCDLVEAASDALHGHDGKVLVACVVRTIHDAHTDAHLELGFVLVLVLDLVLVLVGPCLQLAMLFLPAVGPLFPTVVAPFYPLWVRSFHLSEVIVGAAVDSSLFSTVRSCVRSPGVATCRAPNSHYLCTVRPWLHQGLGCPRADPRVHHRKFSHVLRQHIPSEAAHHTPSHRLG